MWTLLAGRLGSWTRNPAHRRVASAAAVVAFFTLAAKLVGAAKEMIVAYQFGTSDQVDAFILALVIPGFLISVIGGSLNTALIPTYIEAKHRDGPPAAQRLLSTTLFVSIAILIATAAVLVLVLPALLPLIARRFGPEKLALTLRFSYLLLPSLVLTGMSTTWSAVLNALGSFAAPAAAGLAIPLAGIAVLVAFGRDWGVVSLVIGLVAGYFLEAMLVGVALHRKGVSLVPRWGGLTPGVRRVLSQYLPMAAGTLVMGLNPLIDQVMAARLAPGSVASLGYGAKLVSFAMGIASVSLSAAVFPYFSRLMAGQDWEGLHKTIRAYSILLLVATIPVTLAGVAFSNEVVRLLFQRGAFTPADTLTVGRIQACYLLQIPFHLTGMVFVRFISAAAGNRFLMWLSFLVAIVNVAGNYVLSAYMGAAGIALSTSLVYLTSFTLALVYTQRRLRQLRSTPAVLPLAAAS